MTKNRTLKLSYIFYSLVLLTHLLIIFRVIPYTWINGGRSESYTAQLPISFANLAITGLGFLYVFTNQKAKSLQSDKRFRVFKWALVPFWGLSLAMQFLGTSFEIFVMSPVVFLGLFSHVQLARLR